MKKIIFILFFTPQLLWAELIPSDVVDTFQVLKDAADIVTNLGYNCANNKDISYFVKELYRILQGIGITATESTTQLLMKPDFPTACHVLTKEHLKSYNEETIKSHARPKCLLRDPITKRCISHMRISYERPKPSYYWPKYFIEVSEKGNDSHSAFAKNNKLYQLNRDIANKISKNIDYGGSVKLTSYVMGGKSLLSAIGLKVGEQDWSQLTKGMALVPFENLRIRSSKKTSMPSYDVNIWPIPLSYTLASHFTVCGPDKIKKFEHPGGSFATPAGVSLTCPMAMSSDAISFWDTGMLDYLDPKAIAAMAAGSNIVSCGMDIGAQKLASLSSSKSSPIGDQSSAQGLISKFSESISFGLSNCSYPILGTSHALAKKALSMADPGKWKDINCTLWGSLAPRMSTSIYDNDYSYANAALKFKLLAHELFGIPRGAEERWSLAYPWEGPDTSIGSSGPINQESILSNFVSGINKALNLLGIKIPTASAPSRAEALIIPGDPSMINASTSLKHAAVMSANYAKEIAAISAFKSMGEPAIIAAEIARNKNAQKNGDNLIPGDKRIYTVWEKIECKSETQKVTTEILGNRLSKYSNCEKAIQLEVYKYIQTKLLRKICDLFGQKVGKPWN